MLVFVHVIQEQLATRFWAVYQFNTVPLTISVHRVEFAKQEFVRQFVLQIANVLPISCVYKEFANQRVTIIQLVLNSNFVKTIFAHKKFDAEATTTACRMNTVKPIHTVDQSAEMHVKDVICAQEMLNARLEIMMQFVLVNKVSLKTPKVNVAESSVHETMNAPQINSVKRIFANWPVKVVKRAAKRPFVRLKAIGRFATANLVIAEIHTNNVMRSTIVAMLPADQVPCVQTTKELSIALAVMDTLEIHTMKDAVWLLSAQTMQTVQQVRNVFNQIANRSVEMFAKALAAVRIQSVFQLIMLLYASVYRDTEVKLPML